MGVKQLPHDVEAILPDAVQAFTAKINPAGFYQTWAREEVPSQFRETIHAAGLHKAVSISCLIATAGAYPEEHLSQLLMNGETAKAQIATALSEEAAELSLNFLYKLLGDDAKSDDCEVAEPVAISTDPLLSETLQLMQADQEGIFVDQASHLTPRFTRIALVAWIPISKRKKQALPPKKKSV